MGVMAPQITSLTIVYSIVYSGADQRKHQSCTSLAFVRGIHRGPVNSPHKGPVTRKMFPFDDVIMVKFHQNMTSTNELSNKTPPSPLTAQSLSTAMPGSPCCSIRASTSSCGLSISIRSTWPRFGSAFITISSSSWGKINSKDQMTFLNAICWRRMIVFLSKFHFSLFSRDWLIISQHWLRSWPGA